MTEDFILLFTDILESYCVQYLIVGGCASIIYKEKNYTNDLDLLIKPTQKNYQSLSMFLETLGYDFNIKDFTSNGILRIISKPFSIDFHSKLDGVNIERAFTTYNKIKIGHKELKFISKLLLDKNLIAVNQMTNKYG